MHDFRNLSGTFVPASRNGLLARCMEEESNRIELWTTATGSDERWFHRHFADHLRLIQTRVLSRIPCLVAGIWE